jgi:cytochrome c
MNGFNNLCTLKWLCSSSRKAAHRPAPLKDVSIGFAQTLLSSLIVPLSSATFVVSASSWSLSQDLSSSSAVASSGQLAFNNACRTCHSVKEGDNRLGPNLYKVLGRKAGSLPDYSYSSAMRSADFVWDKETLDRFIANPEAVLPGNKMKPYGGLEPADVRAKVIAFLATLTTGQ